MTKYPLENISVQDTTTWIDFATAKYWKKRLRKKSAKKELTDGTLNLMANCFPGFLKFCKMTPDALIEETDMIKKAKEKLG